MKLKFVFLSLLLVQFVDIKAQYNARVLEYFKKHEIGEEKIKSKVHLLIEIGDRESDWHAEFNLSYDELNEIKIRTAEIWSLNNEPLRKLKKSDIKDEKAYDGVSFITDEYEKCFELKWHQFPYRIFVEYEIESNFPVIDYWDPAYSYYLSTDNARLEILADKQIQLLISDTVNYNYLKTEDKNEVKHTWESKFDAFDPNNQKMRPQISEMIDQVYVTRKNFFMRQEGKMDSWKNFGNWQYRLNAGLDELTEVEKTRIDKILEGVSSDKDKIRLLYNYMQDNTRYVGIQLGVGGWQSLPASFVCDKKYGDCKALTTYMKAMLNYINIPSNECLIYAGKSKKDYSKQNPGFYFNHVILAIPMQEDTIWLENTSQLNPVNYLGSFTEGRTVLWIDSTNSQLLNTPALGKEQNSFKRIYEFNISGNKSFYSIKLDAKGTMFEHLLRLEKEDQRQKIKNLASVSGFSVSVDSFHYQHRDRNDPNIKAVVYLTSSEMIKEYNHQSIVRIPEINIPEFELPEDRIFPVSLNLPIYKIDSLIFDLGEIDVNKISHSDNVSIDSDYGNFKLQTNVIGNKLIIARELYIKKAFVELKDYPAFYDFIQSAQHKDENFYIKIKKI